eukprot:gene18541-26190_t
MVGVPPQSANERRENDRMEDYYQQMEGVYSSGLIELMRWSLMMDPLQRPQSVFALQKALRKLSEDEHSHSGLLSRLRRLPGGRCVGACRWRTGARGNNPRPADPRRARCPFSRRTASAPGVGWTG